MQYEKALEYIRASEKFGIRPGLSRMRELMKKLGDPQNGVKYIHVAGTNGKGSTCAFLASALAESGYKTGLFISPYVVDFRERISINGGYIGKDAFAKAAGRVFSAAAELSDKAVTEFELITAIAFCWFQSERCDYVVLEVGLGGRFDATNIVGAPECCVITKIDLDHTEILGDTIEKIAFEKSGIIKNGVGFVVSNAKNDRQALRVISQKAGECGAEFVRPDMAALSVKSESLAGTEFCYRGREYKIALCGEHQIDNALCAIETLSRLGLCGARAAEGLAKASFPARMEILAREPPVILDGAHNPSGVDSLAAALKRFLPDKKIVTVMGILKDKEHRRCVEKIASISDRLIAVAVPSPRTLSAAEVAAEARRFCRAETEEDLLQAAKRAAEYARQDGAVLICGSLYLASEMRKKFKMNDGV